MKNRYIFSVCMLVVLWSLPAYAQPVLKEKKLSGRFPSQKGKLFVDNRYGKLDINTWDKNEVIVEITITAKAKSADRAQELLDRVSIVGPGDKGIYYKTVVGNGKSTRNGETFRIDYSINMPRKHAAEFRNKYGDIEISDVDGPLEIDLEYGNLQTAAIRGRDNDIKVGFGSATIMSIESGNITAAYSRLSIDKAGSIEVANQFKNTVIGSVRDLNIDQKYGDLKIGTVSQLNATVQYANLYVDKLLKSVQMTLSHCGKANFRYIGPDVDNISVNSSFSNLQYHFDAAVSLSGNIAVSFGNVSSSIGSLSTTASRPGGSSTYKLNMGAGRGSMQMKVSYGNVVIR